MGKTYYVLVRYLDSDNNEGVVPSSDIKGFTPPGFDSARIYDVFWSRDSTITIESMSKSRTKIPVYEVNSKSTEPGYYKAKIIHLAENVVELDAFTNARSARKLLANRHMTPSTSGTSGSSDSGVSSRSKKQDSNKKNGKGASKQPVKSTKNDVESGSETDGSDSSASSSCDSDASTAHKSSKKRKRPSYKDLKKALKKAEKKAKILEKENKRYRDRNWEYQDEIQMMKLNKFYCCQHKGGSPNLPMGSNNTAQIQTQQAASSIRVLGTIAPNGEWTEFHQPDTLPTTPPVPDTQIIAENEHVDNDANIEGHPGEARLLLLAPTQPEEVTDEEQQIQLLPPHNIYLAKKLCDKNDFKGHLLAALENHDEKYFGRKGDSRFIRDAALALWGSAHLLSHTVSGEKSNANLKKEVGPPLKKLDPTEVAAIKCALSLRIEVQKALPLPQCMADYPQGTLQERLGKVNYEIGQKIASLKKTVEGAKMYRQFRQQAEEAATAAAAAATAAAAAAAAEAAEGAAGPPVGPADGPHHEPN